MPAYEPGRYRDSDTGRYRWGVLQSPSNVWYFPENYGKAAAVALANKMRREAA